MNALISCCQFYECIYSICMYVYSARGKVYIHGFFFQFCIIQDNCIISYYKKSMKSTMRHARTCQQESHCVLFK